MWGVWVSLSEDNFNRYVETYDSPETEDCHFGWFCNDLPYYENTFALKTHVHPRAGRDRPYIKLEDTSHPLSVDFHQGISIKRAQKIVQAFMHR